MTSQVFIIYHKLRAVNKNFEEWGWVVGGVMYGALDNTALSLSIWILM